MIKHYKKLFGVIACLAFVTILFIWIGYSIINAAGLSNRCKQYSQKNYKYEDIKFETGHSQSEIVNFLDDTKVTLRQLHITDPNKSDLSQYVTAVPAASDAAITAESLPDLIKDKQLRFYNTISRAQIPERTIEDDDLLYSSLLNNEPIITTLNFSESLSYDKAFSIYLKYDHELGWVKNIPGKYNAPVSIKSCYQDYSL